MAQLTRHDLKRSEFRDSISQLQDFFRRRYKDILLMAGILLVIVGGTAGVKIYYDQREAEAAVQLAAALQTFHAYVGAPGAGNPQPDSQTFPTRREKYKKALGGFAEIVRNYSGTKASEIARYHLGVCQALLGDDANALKTLEEASRSADRELASLARLALANEMAKTGKLQDAMKILDDLAAHPTLSVPAATALFAEADACRTIQPAQARLIYERVGREFASDTVLAQAVKQQIETLPH